MRSPLLFVALFYKIALSAVAQSDDQNNLRQPKTITVGSDLTKAESQQLIRTAPQFYAFWNTCKKAYAKLSVSSTFYDNTLPMRRPQGFKGLLFAAKNFRTAVPDLTCTIEDLLIAKEKVTTRFSFKGHNTGVINRHTASGHVASIFAIDILPVAKGKNVEDGHPEDNLTFLQQVGVVKL